MLICLMPAVRQNAKLAGVTFLINRAKYTHKSRTGKESAVFLRGAAFKNAVDAECGAFGKTSMQYCFYR
jgi:hypothetical protein